MRGHRWHLAGLAIATTVLASCGSSSRHGTAPPLVSAAQRAADKTKIIAMLRADNDAWNLSRTAGIVADIFYTWPPSRAAGGMTFDQCNRYLNAQLWENDTVDPSTIRPDPGWLYPLTRTVPEGRIYVMTMRNSSRYGAHVQPTHTQEVHAVIAPDGHAYDFQQCHD